MDITRLKNNYEYYSDAEINTEVVISLQEDEDYNIHIDEKFFGDIFMFSPAAGDVWKGFTRDYQEQVGAWDFKLGNKAKLIDLDEYISDMLYYTDKLTKFEETGEVFDLILDFLTYAKQTGQTVIVEVS